VKIKVDPVPCSGHAEVLPPSPARAWPPPGPTHLGTGFLVTTPGTRWRERKLLLRLWSRGWAARTRARNPGPYRLRRGRGDIASPQACPEIHALKNAASSPRQPHPASLPRPLSKKTSWLESQGEKVQAGLAKPDSESGGRAFSASRRPAVSKNSATGRTFSSLDPTPKPPGSDARHTPSQRVAYAVPSQALLMHRGRDGRIKREPRRQRR